jgi:hypothetical protein
MTLSWKMPFLISKLVSIGYVFMCHSHKKICVICFFPPKVAKLDSESSETIMLSHVNAWASVWEDGLIEIEGNTDLSKVVFGSLYYILSSLPVVTETNTPVRQFYGLSPGGLAYGDYLMDYQGNFMGMLETFLVTTPDIITYRL